MFKSVIAIACLAASATSVPVPDKTVVLTFDDAVKSHVTFVGPYLKELGFGATFFVTHGWMNDAENFMTWEDIGQLHGMGFEIGNHSWTHQGFNSPKAASMLAGELALVENELSRVGVPKPITFGWTGNAFGPESLRVLEGAGYRLARRGMQPEAAYGSLQLGALFDPSTHHALLIPSAGDAYPNWTVEHFKTVVDRARDGKIAVVQFHGIPDIAHPWVHTTQELFKQCMDHLKQGGFNVIAMRDLEPFLPAEAVTNDAMKNVRYPALGDLISASPVEVRQTRADLDYWIQNMVAHHAYSIEEAALVTGLNLKEMESYLEHHAALAEPAAQRAADGRIKVLPYPGGRHPRIGFLEGAIDPQRGTKVSIFPPWEGSGYVVLDLPEAIFSNLGLMYLAHTHVPTIWNAENKFIDNIDWTRVEDGDLAFSRTLPNGVAFGATVTPTADDVKFDLWLENGTPELLTKLRTQICLMLKGAPAFNDQSEERRLLEDPVAAIKAKDSDRWILVAFDHCGRVWGNTKCPCIHSDPVFDDAKPGERVSVKGRVWFHEGPDIQAAIQGS
ncbi:MAG: hypothetical protein AMXMBFR84_04140 [Candidatus Hydrogenedentota bacterium]